MEALNYIAFSARQHNAERALSPVRPSVCHTGGSVESGLT